MGLSDDDYPSPEAGTLPTDPVSSEPLPMGPAVAKLTEIEPERYRRDGEVGHGGIGTVVRAIDTRFDRVVALKELSSRGEEERFVREAMITARLQHPGIVPVHDVGRWPTGEPFYAMKLVNGR